MKRKMIGMAIVGMMILSSLAIISMSTVNVVAEDSSRPVVPLDNGYPLSNTFWDQEQTFRDGAEGPIGQGQSMAYVAQRFVPSVSGELQHFGAWLDTFSGGGNMYWDLRSGTPTGGSLIGGFQTISIGSRVMNTWNYFSMPVTVNVVGGNSYSFVITSDPGTSFFWHTGSGNPYPAATDYESIDDSTWLLLNGGIADFAFRTYMEVPTDGISKVAWHESGEFALGITGYDAQVWNYSRASGQWSLEGEPSSDINFYDITYDRYYDQFILAGEDWNTGHPIAYRYVNSGWSIMTSPSTQGTFHAVAPCGGIGGYWCLAVGETSGGYGYAAWYDGSTWKEVTNGFQPGFPEQLNDVTWNYKTGTSSRHYAVGIDDESQGFIYEFALPGTTTTARTHYGDRDANILEPGMSIAWNPQASQGVLKDYGLIGAWNYNGHGNVYRFNGTLAPRLISESTDTINDIGWRPDGDFAFLVGEDSGGVNGVFYVYMTNRHEIVDKSFMLPSGTAPLKGVALKGYSSPSSALLTGTGGAIGIYPSATDIGTQLTLNTAFPHIFDIDMWLTSDATETSVLNSEVDVEDTYTFFTTVNYTVGGVDQIGDSSNVTYVDLICWYDTGAELMNVPADADDVRTQKFTVRWMEGNGPGLAGQSAWVTSPIVPVLETTVVGSGISGPYNPVANAYHYDLWINVSFTSQMRAADLGGGGVASGDITDSAQSFNDADSWNIQMNVGDTSAGAGAYNSVFEEFGLFKATNVTVSGNPAGNTPPGSATTLSPYSFINYTANTNYYINVSVKDLTGPQTITADNIGVRLLNYTGLEWNEYTEIPEEGGGFFMFAGADIQQMVWGNTSMPTKLISAPDNGTFAHGQNGSNYWLLADDLPSRIEWWVNVPAGVAEGTYTAQITFVIGDGW